MHSHEQFRHGHNADVHFLGWFPVRQIDWLVAVLEFDEDIGVNHQSHVFASMGNWARMAQTSCENSSASSPKEGRFRKKPWSSPTVRGDAGKCSIVTRTSA